MLLTEVEPAKFYMHHSSGTCAGVCTCITHIKWRILQSTNASICSTIVFPLLRTSGHAVIPVSIDFPINSKQDAPFHCVAYDYFCADCQGLCDHLRDLPLEDIFKLSVSAAASEFCERVQVGIDLYIFYHEYQVKRHLPPWF